MLAKNRWKCLFGLACSTIVYLLGSTAGASEVIGLDAAVSNALTNNLDALVLEQEKKIHEEMVNGSVMRMLPSLILSWDYSHKSDDVPSTSMNYMTKVVQLTSSISTDRELHRESATLSWDMLNFALETYRYKQAKVRGAMTGERLKRFKQNVTLDVVKSYMNALTAKKSADLAAGLRGRIENRLGVIRSQMGSSLLDEVEGMEKEINFLGMQYRLHAFEKNYESAKAELAKLMGLPSDARFEVKMLNFPASPKWPSIDVASFTEEALKSRPELAEITKELAVQDLESDRTLVEMFPSLSAYYKYEKDSNSFLENDDWNVAGLKVSWDLLSLPRTMSDRQISKIKERKLEKHHQAIAAAVATQVKLAASEYRELGDTIGILRNVAEKRKKLMTVVDSMVKAGKAYEASLLDTEQRYLAAEIEYLTAFSKYFTFLARIYNAVGRDFTNPEQYLL